MHHSLVFALPAVLRSALILAATPPHSFRVYEDLLAFPQYEVEFPDEYISEHEAQSRLRSNQQRLVDTDLEHEASQETPPSQLDHYKPQPTQHYDGRDDENDLPPLEYETMILNGQRYLCGIPQVKKPQESPPTNDTLLKVEEEQELFGATVRGWELLSGMRGSCVYFVANWWSYRFCFDDGVRQFHQLPPSLGVPPYPPVEDPSVQGFSLGQISQDKDKQDAKSEQGLEFNDSLKVELVQRGESRYLVQRLEGGSTCDLTGKQRKTEVQFHCNPQQSDRISLIKETSTCAYLMVIQTPRLCNDVAFMPPKTDHANAISCRPILGQDQTDVYERNLKASNSAEAARKIAKANALAESALATSILTGKTANELAESALAESILTGRTIEQPLKIAGNIAVGARALIPEGVTLEKSAIVGGGKETYVDTIASSDGRVLSKEDMDKLGLDDPEAIEQFKKELQRVAKGQDWKLDVIDTPAGRKYRGIIGSTDEEEEQAEDGGDDQKEGKGDDEAGSHEEYYKEDL